MSLTNSSSRSNLQLVPKKKTASTSATFANQLPGTEIAIDAYTRVKNSVDASHYMLMPSAVVTPTDLNQIAQLFDYATTNKQNITFRSGGTSLSGQGVTDGFLVDVREKFRDITVLADGMQVKVEPGATVRQVNARLAKYGRKLGPDPASEIACTIGGVVANNSSGMACGITENSYRTMASAVVILPSGTRLDTADANADRFLHEAEPALYEAIANLKSKIANRPDLRAEIQRQYQIKNTMGYSLNALIDFESVSETLAHLMVGSEGTLGFLAQVTFNTVPIHKHIATTFLIFHTLKEATAALEGLVATNATTIELLDAASLRTIKQVAVEKNLFDDFEVVNHAGLLVEYQSSTQADLLAKVANASALIATLPIVNVPILSSEATVRYNLWSLRKGLYAAVAGVRPSGTTALLEDISVPVKDLSATCESLQVLFEEYGYDDAVIFGHAKDGNIHFLLNEDFSDPAKVSRYAAFTESMVDLVLSMKGSLKAEHGTGRTMAPFVRRQFGDELYEVMCQIKAAFDPANILNPGVLISADPKAHIKNIKTTPTVEKSVDNCVECGYCEPVCPSKSLTATPRQRIVVRRAIANARIEGNHALVKELESAEDYGSIQTCAVDGMCATSCPLSINTGTLVSELRSQRQPRSARKVWNYAAENWKVFTETASFGLNVAKRIPAPLLIGSNQAARSVLGEDNMPLWSKDLPGGGKPRIQAVSNSKNVDFVLFQACVGTMFGTDPINSGVAPAFEELCEKAGLTFARPEGISNLCCGTPWKSKGVREGYQSMAERTLGSIWEATDSGRIPVVVDNSSCTEGLVEMLRSGANAKNSFPIQFVDAVDYVAVNVLEKLSVKAAIEKLVVHPTCSSTRLGSNENLMTLANAISENAIVPDNWGCCAFAGDRGMLHPELTESATRLEAQEVAELGADAHVSCNRTCEIGMTRATGQTYQHVLELLNANSTSKD